MITEILLSKYPDGTFSSNISELVCKGNYKSCGFHRLTHDLGRSFRFNTCLRNNPNQELGYFIFIK